MPGRRAPLIKVKQIETNSNIFKLAGEVWHSVCYLNPLQGWKLFHVDKVSWQLNELKAEKSVFPVSTIVAGSVLSG